MIDEDRAPIHASVETGRVYGASTVISPEANPAGGGRVLRLRHFHSSTVSILLSPWFRILAFSAPLERIGFRTSLRRTTRR